ncbi:MAG TPA: hypothetical protein VF141_13015 [Chryseolinea sp.]
MNKNEIAKEFTRQMLDQNTPSVNFEQVARMLNQVGTVYEKVLSDMSKYQYEHQLMRCAFSDHRSQLKSLEEQISTLNANLVEQLTDSSTRLSKYQKSSRLKRYLTPTVVGIISALLTNLIWWIMC